MADLEPYLCGALRARGGARLPDCGVDARCATDPDARPPRAVAEAHAGRAPRIVTYRVARRGHRGVPRRARALLARRLPPAARRAARRATSTRSSRARPLAGGGGVEVVVDRVKVAASDARRLGAAIEEAWRRGAGDAPPPRAPPGARRDDARLRVAARARLPEVRAAVRAAARRASSRTSRRSARATRAAASAAPSAIDWAKVIPDERASLKAGAIRPWSGTSTTWERGLLAQVLRRRRASRSTSRGATLTDEQRALVLDGEGAGTAGKYPGVRAWFKWLETRTYKMHVRVLLARYRAYDPCTACDGKRLSPTALAYHVGGLDLAAWHALELARGARAPRRARDARPGKARWRASELVAAARRTSSASASATSRSIGRRARSRAARRSASRSPRRSARRSPARSSCSTSRPWACTRPTSRRSSSAMRELAARGNVGARHRARAAGDPRRAIASSSSGPARARQAGASSSTARPRSSRGAPTSPTGRALAPRRDDAPRARAGEGRDRASSARARNNLQRRRRRHPARRRRRRHRPERLGQEHARRGHPLPRPRARARLHATSSRRARTTRIEGTSGIARVAARRSIAARPHLARQPGDVHEAWDRIRALFAAAPEARRARPHARRTSRSTSPLGRCEACSGEGYETVEMQFLADVALICPVCRGKRFKDEVLAVTHRAADRSPTSSTLDVDEALALFARESRRSSRALGPLARLGLGYLPLGQPLSTLSGGEAQRLKLARALGEPAAGTLFVLDEPSAGLHADEVARSHARSPRSVARGRERRRRRARPRRHPRRRLGDRSRPRRRHRAAAASSPRARPRTSRKTDTRTGRGPRATRSASDVAQAPNVEHERRSPRGPAAIDVVARARAQPRRTCRARSRTASSCVVTGPSGSGKSTLAFDVVFAEGQRRFLETLTPYARQFLPTLPRPDVDRVTGVPPSIALEQRTTRARRELDRRDGDRDRPLPAAPLREGRRPALPEVRRADRARDRPTRSIASSIAHARRSSTLLAPAVARAEGHVPRSLHRGGARRDRRARDVDGAQVAHRRAAAARQDAASTRSISIVYEGKLADLDATTFDRALACAATRCASKIASQRQGRRASSSRRRAPARAAAPASPSSIRAGSRSTPSRGAARRARAPASRAAPRRWPRARTHRRRASACGGSRLAPVPRARAPRRRALPRGVGPLRRGAPRAGRSRCASPATRAHRRGARTRSSCAGSTFVLEVGLGYLALDRRATTLSGGEMQRLRLAAQLGSGLTGALYVLDEPTIGLHPRDTRAPARRTSAPLADTGSTVLVVEHDADTIRAADHLIDLGPAGGRNGGRIVAEGPPRRARRSRVADRARPRRRASHRARRAPAAAAADAWIELTGAPRQQPARSTSSASPSAA